MKKDLISIIVPVYNVEKYLEKCLDSLINQTYTNTEIILVNDCSTDGSGKIAKQYSKKYKNIVYLENKKNSGLSHTRNVGIESAKGKYIGFIDSDDYVSLDFFEKLHETITNEKADVAIADIKIVYEETGLEVNNTAYNQTQDSIGFINTGLAASACNKLFKKSLFDTLKFEEGKINEDIAVVIPILANAKKISYVANVYYYYIQRNNSIQNSKFSEKRFDIIYAIDLTLSRIENCKNYSEIKDAIIFNQIIVLMIYVIPSVKNIFKRAKFIKKYYKLTKKFDVLNNIYYKEFLINSGKKHRIYYNYLMKFTCHGLSFSASMMCTLYNILKVFLKKSRIMDFNNDIIVEHAKANQKCSDHGIKISVVIPNYNYARFLGQRLDSILYQKVKIHELIILDDCSKDNSIEVINKYVDLLKPYINIRTIINKDNSGSAFKQWQKGFEEATGDYLWIAEADDYCDKKMLKELVKPIKKDKDIIISYVDTAFIDTWGSCIVKTIKPEIDIQKTGHWNKSYINDGLDEINGYSYLNNTIANVSSCIIKKGDYKDTLERATTFKQAGDWLFYTDAIAKGKISYTNKTFNYYRVHGNNVSSTMNHMKHLEELNKIYDYYTKKYNLNDKQQRKIKDRIKFLKDVWKIK